MNPGIDLQGSFVEALINWGLPAEIAKVLWLPLPMLLMIVGAVFGVLTSVWLERKFPPPLNSG